jgi:hypothetical protein
VCHAGRHLAEIGEPFFAAHFFFRSDLSQSQLTNACGSSCSCNAETIPRDAGSGGALAFPSNCVMGTARAVPVCRLVRMPIEDFTPGPSSTCTTDSPSFRAQD